MTSRLHNLIASPEDFVVKEILGKRYTKYSRTSGGIALSAGPNSLCLLKKRNLTTKEAVKRMARHLGIGVSGIGYAGLKDRFAVTEQYITVRGDVADFELDGLSVKKIGMTNKFMSAGDLAGNRFIITLHNCSPAMERKVKGLRAFPNYFGPQRFGRHGNNHVIGRHLVKREFGSALGLINKNKRKKYKSIKSVPKDELKFYVNAYQSYLFNKILEAAIRQGKNVNELLLVGFGTKLSKTDKILAALLKKEGVKPENFSIPELSLSCNGSSRKALIKLTGLQYSMEGTTMKLDFTLPAGSYATALLKELESPQRSR